MKDAKFERHHHTIKDLETGDRKPYPTVNQAKRVSRKIQLEMDGGLGRGAVRLAH